MTVAVRNFLLLAAAILTGCEGGRPPAQAEPKTLAAAEITRVVSALPSYARFTFSGVAFVDGRLYVSSNVGLIELQGTEVKGLHRWYEDFNVISGPWADPPRGAVWAHRADDGYFVRRDAKGWLRIDLPKPSKGYYSRGDFLEGFTGVSNAESFRLVGAGNVWRWTDPGQWIIEPSPPAEEFSDVVGVGTQGDRAVYLVRRGVCPLPPCTYGAYWRESERWSEPLGVPVGRLEDVTSTSDAVYVRGGNGDLFRVERSAISRVDTPGPCEAIARTSDGKLLASFRGIGVFVQDRGWVKILEDPYPKSEGEHWAYLAESKGRIAFATASVPHLKPGTDNQWIHTGTDALWVSEGERLVRVEVLKK